MGRTKRHFKGSNHSQDKKRRRDNEEKWRNTRGDNQDTRGWTQQTDNARMQAFYKAQHFVEPHEWNSFVEHLRAPLPACFRICPDYPFAADLRAQLLEYAGKSVTGIDGQEISPVEQIRWYPSGYGYKLGTDRRQLRKLDALNQLHAWMKQHTDNGNITRQEAVSMVPPLALNVEPHHKCLDMCAAPGSKTSQLLEIVNRSLEYPIEQQGLVVANDSDTDRAYMLVHQCKRINSPSLLITTHKGQMFPTVTEEEFFDRVLCDVPCSGDGTLRKNPGIWGRWNTALGTTLHPLQLLIAQRGLQLLKPGGLMVYSTCSLSPYENESVVAELLRSSNGTLELLDAREFIPGFKARPGLSTWYVLDDYIASKRERTAKKKASEQDTIPEELREEAAAAAAAAAAAKSAGAEAEEGEEKNDFSDITDAELRVCLEMGMNYYPDFSSVPQHLDRKLRPSMFPPTAEEKEWMHLERCLRCVPQDEDTGGFFVATLRKTANRRDDKRRAYEEQQQGASVEVEEAELAAAKEAARAAEDEAAEGGDDADAVDRQDDAAGEEADQANTNTVTDAAADGQDGEQQQQQKPRTQGLVGFHPWDAAAYQRVKDFYDFDEMLPADSMFVREDFVTTTLNAKKGKKYHTATSKSVYFLPYAARQLLSGPHGDKLKLVGAGIKVFERKDMGNGVPDYRLLQEGIQFMAKHIRGRKIPVSAQDFCNILGGGLVSYSTLSEATLKHLAAVSTGIVVCVYTYDPIDIVADSENNTSTEAAVKTGTHTFHAVCWRGPTKTLNVMCGGQDIETLKHQMKVLRVYREKIMAPKFDINPTAAIAATAAGDAAATPSAAGTEGADVEMEMESKTDA